MAVPTENDPSKAAAHALPATDDVAQKKPDDQTTLTSSTLSSKPEPTPEKSDTGYMGLAAAWLKSNENRLQKNYRTLEQNAEKAAAVVGTKFVDAMQNLPESFHNAFDRIAAYAHKRGVNHYGGECASIVRQDFFQPAGIMTNLDPHGNAYQYARFLEAKGFKDMRDDWSPETARPGDVVVFDRTRSHRDGHIQVMGKDGNWYSDCQQEHFLPNQHGFGNFHVYRTADLPASAATIVAPTNTAARVVPETASTAMYSGNRRNHGSLLPHRRENSAEAVQRHLASTEAASRPHGRGHSHGMRHGPTLTG